MSRKGLESLENLKRGPKAAFPHYTSPRLSARIRQPKNQKNNLFLCIFGTQNRKKVSKFGIFHILIRSWLILVQHDLQDASKTSPRRLPKPPRRPQDASKSAQDGQDRPQDASKTAHGVPKRPPDVSKSAQDASQMPSRPPKTSPRGLQTPSRTPKTSPRCRQVFQGGPRMPPGRPRLLLNGSESMVCHFPFQFSIWNSGIQEGSNSATQDFSN